jgi:hypothetical protein
MEKRGYRVEPEIKAKIKTGKYQSLKSIQKNKYKKLYESASSEIEGKIVGGEQKRSYERSEASKRAAETRRRKRDLNVKWKTANKQQEYEESYDTSYEEDEWTEADERSYRRWQERRREQDERDRLEAELYNEGRIAYDQIYELIGEYPTPGSKMLANALRSEIGKYGEQKVIQAMGNAPSSFIATAQQIVYYEEESSAIHSAIVSFVEVIRGTILNETEAKEIGETMDEMTDMGTL